MPGMQCTTDERFNAWWSWQVDQWEWSAAAEDCLDAMRAEVTP